MGVVVGAGVVGTAAAAGLILLLAGTLQQTWALSFALVIAAPILVVPVLWALLDRGWRWSDLGFVRGRGSLWHLLWEVPLAWGGALVLTITVASLIGIAPSGESSGTADAATLGVGALLLTALCSVLAIPALEEICFRRVFYGWLEQRAGAAAAVLVSAALFGLVHVVPAVMLLQFFIGIGAGVLVRRHRTLWASLALHSLNNAVVVLGVGVSLLQSR